MIQDEPLRQPEGVRYISRGVLRMLRSPRNEGHRHGEREILDDQGNVWKCVPLVTVRAREAGTLAGRSAILRPVRVKRTGSKN
jgi:hypothetical protein